MLVYEGDGSALTTVRERAVAREIPAAIYTDDMFSTGHDDDNRAVVSAVPPAGLRLAGIAVYGPRNAVDKVCKGLALHH